MPRSGRLTYNAPRVYTEGTHIALLGAQLLHGCQAGDINGRLADGRGV
jgi:hypothetical protein